MPLALLSPLCFPEALQVTGFAAHRQGLVSMHSVLYSVPRCWSAWGRALPSEVPGPGGPWTGRETIPAPLEGELWFLSFLVYGKERLVSQSSLCGVVLQSQNMFYVNDCVP